MRKTSSQSELTASEVLDIMHLASKVEKDGTRTYSDAYLGRCYDVSRKAVYNIRNRYTWRHVPSPATLKSYPGYTVFPDGRVYSKDKEQFLTTLKRSNGPAVRVRSATGKRGTVLVKDMVKNAFGSTTLVS